MSELKLCPKCRNPSGYNSYFKSYYCSNCGKLFKGEIKMDENWLCPYGYGICTAPKTECPHWQGTFCQLDDMEGT